MNVEDRLDMYLNESSREIMNEAYSTFIKKEFPNIDPTKNLVTLPSLTIARMFMNNDLFGYMQTKMDNFNDFYELVRTEFDKVSNSYDLDVLNRAIYKTEYMRTPGKLNKKEKAEFKKVKSWAGKTIRGWFKEYKASLETHKVKIDKLNSWSRAIAPTREKPAYEEFMKKVFGITKKTKKSSWR